MAGENQWLQEQVDECLKGERGETLLRGVIAGLNDENLLNLAACQNLLLLHTLAGAVRARSRDSAFVARVVASLRTADVAQREGLLRVLGHVALPEAAGLRALVQADLLAREPRVREAAATVVAQQFPQHARQAFHLVARSAVANALHIGPILCYSRNQDLILPLAAFYEAHDRRLPPTFGFLLTPRWLAKQHVRRPELVARLAQAFGYTDHAVTPATAAMLRGGLMFVSAHMADLGWRDDWRSRVIDFCRQLLPQALGPLRADARPVDMADPIDTALFIAAARQCDVDNLQLSMERNPFTYRARASFRAPVCFHAPAAYCRRTLIEAPVAQAATCTVPPARLGEFVVEYVRNWLIHDAEAHTEADLLTRSRWHAMQRNPGLPETPRRVPIRSDADFPLLKFGVVRADLAELPEANPQLSPGARGTANLAHLAGLPEVGPTLAAIEEFYGPRLPPIGIELQVPRPDPNLHFCWKQALRFAGVPSPRRPEFGRTVEAAFRPAKSFHIQALNVLLLARLGLFAVAQDSALHISIQGDLGDGVRYLAFPQQFMNLSSFTTENPDLARSRRTRVMSKGFVNCNRDVEPVARGETPACRTEIRVFGCYAERLDTPDALGLRLSFADDLAATHLLATSAMATTGSELHAVWSGYTAAVDGYVAGLPEEFSELLHSNWREATGDPQDPDLMALLPINAAREKACAVCREQGLADALERRLSTIVQGSARAAYAVLVADALEPIPAGSRFETACGVPLFVPPELARGVVDGRLRLP